MIFIVTLSTFPLAPMFKHIQFHYFSVKLNHFYCFSDPFILLAYLKQPSYSWLPSLWPYMARAKDLFVLWRYSSEVIQISQYTRLWCEWNGFISEDHFLLLLCQKTPKKIFHFINRWSRGPSAAPHFLQLLSSLKPISYSCNGV